MTTDPIGLYVHIPFCIRKCNYCDFCSYPGRIGEQLSLYVSTLLKEARQYARAEKIRVNTLYFGGGTPSLLTPSEFEKILLGISDVFDISEHCELTLEANPGTFDFEKMSAYRSLGVNRISIGIQSFQDKFQKVLGRTAVDVQAMAAVLKLDKDTVISLAQQFEKLYAVNLNCPGQIVVSGLKSSLDAFAEKVSENGGKVIPLSVSGAFHSPFVESASNEFRTALDGFEIKNTQMPVYANLTAKPYDENIKDTLAMQMKNPVRWQETIENMISDGFTDFIEVGAGKTLSGLIKKISKEVNVYSVQDAETLAKTIEAVKENA